MGEGKLDTGGQGFSEELPGVTGMIEASRNNPHPVKNRQCAVK